MSRKACQHLFEVTPGPSEADRWHLTFLEREPCYQLFPKETTSRCASIDVFNCDCVASGQSGKLVKAGRDSTALEHMPMLVRAPLVQSAGTDFCLGTGSHVAVSRDLWWPLLPGMCQGGGLLMTP